MIFRCRSLLVRDKGWTGVEGEGVADAAQAFHLGHSDGDVKYVVEEDGKRTTVLFNRIEVEGYEPVISRCFSLRIERKGGVKPKQLTLQEVAKKIGWKLPPEELLGEWEGEETEDEAWERQMKNP